MEQVSPHTMVTSSLPSPSTTFYANDDPKRWTVSIISQGLMVAESDYKEIRTVLKQEMEKKQLIGVSLGAPHNQSKLVDALKELETAFPSVFTSDIPRQWLENCELGMARSINYTYTQACKRRRRNVQPFSAENADRVARPFSFDRAVIYVQSKRTMTDTLLSPCDIISRTQRLLHVDAKDIDFDMFKDVLKEDKVYDATTDRIICHIGNKDIEIDQPRSFRSAALIMHERGQDPISFMVEECPAGECGCSDYFNSLADVSKDDRFERRKTC